MADFNFNDEFIAAGPMRYRGKALSRGDAIDKTLAGGDDTGRERVLRLLFENHRIKVTPEAVAGQTDDEKAAGIPVVPALTEEQTARVAELVAEFNRAELDALAAGEPYNVADADKLPNKEAVASAIVRAEAAQA